MDLLDLDGAIRSGPHSARHTLLHPADCWWRSKSRGTPVNGAG